jgi:hypothetical protein
MNTFPVRTNAAGTMAATFSIGKRGPTIRQGQNDPNKPTLLSGVSGDLYVRWGTAPKLYQFQDTSWIDLTNAMRRTVTTDFTYSVTDDDVYIGVRTAGDVLVELPPGIPGRRIIIKDEVGRQPTETITVLASGANTIDGSTEFKLHSRDALTVFYGDEWHVI